ncbi:hypothetical protein DKX38_000530 [Salix brachista]|uniref:Uncharacterized protein n=1 Tax=Salix brachista TaxID=2182728 RepID=A0A5N5P3J3_9ROSI|nr:hypothetical protein DKX38_000530 [Salix brachista]
MVLSATVVGALLGLGTQMYSNALRKLPYMRHPWEHVVGMGLGVVFVNQLVKWDAKLEQDLDKMLQKAKEANERRYFDSVTTMIKMRCVKADTLSPGQFRSQLIENENIILHHFDRLQWWISLKPTSVSGSGFYVDIFCGFGRRKVCKT